MGIRIDSDLQQLSVEDGHNPYTAEDLAIYTPREVDALCQQHENLMDTIEALKTYLSELAEGIERMAPILKDVCDQVEKLEQVAEYEELL